jgi:hypothetical protein
MHRYLQEIGEFLKTAVEHPIQQTVGEEVVILDTVDCSPYTSVLE